MAGKARRRAFGHVEKLPSGHYRASFAGADGQRVKAPSTFTAKAEADRWLSAQRADIERGTYVMARATAPLLSEYLLRWITTHPGLKDSTRHQYRLDAIKHVLPYLGQLRLDAITRAMLREWLTDLGAALVEQLDAQTTHRTATRRDGSATAARAYRLLRAALAAAVEDRVIPESPCTLKGAGTPARASERPTLTPVEVDALAAAVPDRYRALVYLLAWAGLRVGEAAALHRADVTLGARPSVLVTQRHYIVDGRLTVDVPKSAAGARRVALPAMAADALGVHLDAFVAYDLGAPVFTTRTGGTILSTYSQVFTRGFARIGRDDVRVHDLRHTALTMAAAAGAGLADLKARMGHASTRAAEGYLHRIATRDDELAARMGALAGEYKVAPLLRPEEQGVTHRTVN